MSRSTAALCRKRPSPIEKGQSKTWACGITHAIGMGNFLFDSSQNPHISASELYQWFGVSASTGQGKSKLVRDTLKMHQLDPDWCLPSWVEDNPLIWMLSVNGLINYGLINYRYLACSFGSTGGSLSARSDSLYSRTSGR